MAGTPTKANVFDMLKNVVDVLEDARANGNTLLTKIATVEGSPTTRGDYGAAGQPNAALAMRGRLSSMTEREITRSVLEPAIRELAVLADSEHADGDLQLAAEDAFQYMRDQGTPDTFKSRSYTLGAPTANGSNAGNGVVRRVTVDEHGYNRQGIYAETKTVVCIADQHTGRNRHAETMQVRGGTPGFDGLDVAGSGISQNIPSRNSSQNAAEGSAIPNSSFDSGDDSGTVTTMFTNWTLSTTTGVSRESTNVYRGNPAVDDSDRRSLRLTGTVTCRMVLSDQRISFSKGVPVYMGVMVYVPTGTTGDVIITLGTTTKTVDVTTLVLDAWNRIELDLDENLYPEQWNQDGAYVEVATSSIAGNSVDFDDLIVCEMDELRDPDTDVVMEHIVCVGGSNPFLAGRSSLLTGDEFDIADTGGAASTAKITYHLARGGYPNPPNTTGTPTVTDP